MRRLSGENPLIHWVLGRSRRPSRVRRSARIRLGAAPAALCALALAACGTERPGDGDPKAGLEDRVEATVSSSAGSPDPEDDGKGDAEFLVFMQLLNSVAEPCVPEFETPDLEELGETEEPKWTGTAMPPEPPLPDEPPPSEEPADPDAAKKEVPLSSVEKCTARAHTRRISKALKGTPDPTPRQVGDVLRDLGYIDERVRGSQQSGGDVEFMLDLRVLGSSLCLSGSTSGTKTVVESYGGHPEVDCLDVQR
ncbi:hypothetical protein [Streptomyces fulvoviolaceus]|uniref:hypothetical protein n=1 Tax=Streptomyces fulvoviolaceus TaxID=285535 RepID=UPI001F343057|nr:hypothetical protein [Streptomyces fulvoviolaceus]